MGAEWSSPEELPALILHPKLTRQIATKATCDFLAKELQLPVFAQVDPLLSERDRRN